MRTKLITCVAIASLTLFGAPATYAFLPEQSLQTIPEASQPLPDVHLVLQCGPGYIEVRSYRYRNKNIFGQCPRGYFVPGGIAGNRCTKSILTCELKPSCGTGVC